MTDIKEVLKSELREIKPSDDEVKAIKEAVKNFLKLIEPELKKVKADIVVGGSFAKDTIIKKKAYDVDFFARFDKNENISEILESALKKVIKKLKTNTNLKLEKIHGSRDYFSINLSQTPMSLSFEIVPVLKIKSTKEAKNVTDASPLHVVYVKNKINKKKSLADEIRLIKAFCYAQKCYGAESYINGFSGYALELLTCYYGSFLNLIKAVSKFNLKEKILIDMEKFYKRDDVYLKINKAKLQSPMILIDPTQSDRNAAASISLECLNNFVKSCKSFLLNPSKKFFEKIDKKLDVEKLRNDAKLKKAELLILKVNSEKQREDVAGAKLLKYFNLLVVEIKKDYDILKSDWIFNENNKTADYIFIFRAKDKILIRGPPANMEKHVEQFKKRWSKCFVKNKILYSFRKPRSINEILKKINTKNMGIKEVKRI